MPLSDVAFMTFSLRVRGEPDVARVIPFRSEERASGISSR
jgi:hypothetical protein